MATEFNSCSFAGCFKILGLGAGSAAERQSARQEDVRARVRAASTTHTKMIRIPSSFLIARL